MMSTFLSVALASSGGPYLQVALPGTEPSDRSHVVTTAHAGRPGTWRSTHLLPFGQHVSPEEQQTASAHGQQPKCDVEKLLEQQLALAGHREAGSSLGAEHRCGQGTARTPANAASDRAHRRFIIFTLDAATWHRAIHSRLLTHNYWYSTEPINASE